MSYTPYVSIVIPVRNEEKNLPRALESIRNLDFPENKYEIVIVDGYSTDNTVEIAKKYKAKVVLNRKRIRGAGCQVGIDNARGEFIAFTDADCVVPRHWLKDLLKHFKDKNIAAVGGPNITPNDDSLFAKAAGEALWLLTRAGARYGYSSNKVVEIFHNPGCNVIYRKEAIQRAGGFNSKLLTCEDEELDFRIREKGYKILFTPEASVDHYRRPTYKKIYIQAYRYAIGRVQAIKLHWRMARWFHFCPTLLLLSLMISPLTLIFLPYLNTFVIAFLFIVIFSFICAALFLVLVKRRNAFVIYLRVLLNWFLGWGFGFVKGFFQ